MYFSKIRTKCEGTVEEDPVDVDLELAQEELPSSSAEPAQPAGAAYCTLEDVETVTALLPNSTEIESLMQQYKAVVKPVVEEKQKQRPKPY